MKSCRKIKPWLELLAAGELSDLEREKVEAHVDACPACRHELSSWRELLAAAGTRVEVAEAECATIDWDTVAQKIMSKVRQADVVVPMPPRRRQIFSFAPLATAAVSLLVVGLGIFFWTRPRLEVIPLPDEPRFSAADASRLQSGLAREEVISYLRQSQTMLTDLLKDCSSEEMAAWEIRLYSQQAKQLLLQKKYFQANLPALEWLRVRNVSERIDWLNYEILQLDDRQLCSQISRLQRIMGNERLLLKIRLLERDLSFQSYQEV